MIVIAEQIAVPSQPSQVWDVISVPAEVVALVNGAQLGAKHDDGSFDGQLAVKFGAIKVAFAARITLELAESEREGHLTAHGRDAQGGTRFEVHATFVVREDAAAAGSRVTMSGEINLSGKLASLVEAGASAVVRRMTGEFAENLVARCAPPVAVATPTPVLRPRLIARLRLWWARLRGKEVGYGGQAQ